MEYILINFMLYERGNFKSVAIDLAVRSHFVPIICLQCITFAWIGMIAVQIFLPFLKYFMIFISTVHDVTTSIICIFNQPDIISSFTPVHHFGKGQGRILGWIYIFIYCSTRPPLKICLFPAPDPHFTYGSVGRGIFFFQNRLFIHKSGSFKVEQRILFILKCKPVPNVNSGTISELSITISGNQKKKVTNRAKKYFESQHFLTVGRVRGIFFF